MDGDWEDWARQERELAAGIEIGKVIFALASGEKLNGDLAKYAAFKLREIQRKGILYVRPEQQVHP